MKKETTTKKKRRGRKDETRGRNHKRTVWPVEYWPQQLENIVLKRGVLVKLRNARFAYSPRRPSPHSRGATKVSPFKFPIFAIKPQLLLKGTFQLTRLPRLTLPRNPPPGTYTRTSYEDSWRVCRITLKDNFRTAEPPPRGQREGMRPLTALDELRTH